MAKTQPLYSNSVLSRILGVTPQWMSELYRSGILGTPKYMLEEPRRPGTDPQPLWRAADLHRIGQIPRIMAVRLKSIDLDKHIEPWPWEEGFRCECDPCTFNRCVDDGTAVIGVDEQAREEYERHKTAEAPTGEDDGQEEDGERQAEGDGPGAEDAGPSD